MASKATSPRKNTSSLKLYDRFVVPHSLDSTAPRHLVRGYVYATRVPCIGPSPESRARASNQASTASPESVAPLADLACARPLRTEFCPSCSF